MVNARILIITRNLPPLVGGMERLNWHMAEELGKQAQVQVIGPKGAAALKPENVTLSEAPLTPLPLFMLVALMKAIWFALRFKPNVVLAGSGLTAPLAWLASKLCCARSAAYLHGFDITVQSKPYQKVWVPFFQRLDSVIVNSTPTKQLALNAGVKEEKITIVYPGVEIPCTPQPQSAIQSFKKKHGLQDKKILLSVGRFTTRKGLKEFVEQALPHIVQAAPNVMLVVVGEAPKNSLGAGIQSQESIEQTAASLGLSSHLRFLGVITDPVRLATVYEAADLHVFPVREIPNDPEGFGMVAIEAAAHGLATVAFATGGVVDAVEGGVSGMLVAPGDYVGFAAAVYEVLSPYNALHATCAKFARGFSWSEFGGRVLQGLMHR
ncbi:Predicted glycosyl transferase, group 1 [gamma proteobacterium HdN1]|nr:Predicted glycosyl transferase, group 1 [gamma proteobacterium HdN1]